MPTYTSHQPYPSWSLPQKASPSLASVHSYPQSAHYTRYTPSNSSSNSTTPSPPSSPTTGGGTYSIPPTSGRSTRRGSSSRSESSNATTPPLVHSSYPSSSHNQPYSHGLSLGTTQSNNDNDVLAYMTPSPQPRATTQRRTKQEHA